MKSAVRIAGNFKPSDISVTLSIGVVILDGSVSYKVSTRTLDHVTVIAERRMAGRAQTYPLPPRKQVAGLKTITAKRNPQ